MAGAGAAVARQVEVDAVACGRAATEALAARIAAAKLVHPLDAVTVIVPSNPAGLSARRLLGSGSLGAPGLANVSFVTPFRLAELLGSVELGDRRPLTNPVLAAAARRVLGEAPGMFRDVAGHQATQRAVVELYSELSRARPATLAAIAAASTRGADVVRLVDAVRSLLAGHHDEDDLAQAAVARLERDPAVVEALGHVVWHLPERLSPAVQDLVTAVLRTASHAAVVVGLTGAEDADAGARAACTRAGLVVPEDVRVEQPHPQRVLSASDPDEEVRTAIRDVVALAGAGTPLDRIAIFFPTADPYARTLLEQLAAAGIPHNGPATSRLADRMAGRTLLAVLRLDAAGWRRSDVSALLATGPLRTGAGPAPSGRWDTLSREAGVVGGLEDWRTKLRTHAARLRAERATLAEQTAAPEARLRRLEDAAVDTEALGGFVDDLAASLEQLASTSTWTARAAAARDLLGRLLGPEHLRVSWPVEEVDAAARVDAALARLGVLDEIEPDPSHETFSLAVHTELEAKAGRVGRFGDGVLVAPLVASTGLDLDAVLVLGMVEGTCPSSRREDTLLPETDRELAGDGELRTRAERLADLHRSYLTALAAGASTRTVLLPRGDLRDRRARLASRWLLDGIGHHVGRKVFSSEVADLPAEHLQVISSYAEGVAGAPAHGSIADRDVAALLTHVAAGGAPDAHPLATGGRARGFLCNRSRESADFTEWDGNLAGQALPSPAAGAPLSPSRLETWAACPFRYFLAHVLRVTDREDPEEITELGALDRGSLVHTVLERFVREALERPEGPPAPAEPWSASDRHRIVALAEEVFATYEAAGVTGRPLLWRRTRAQVLDDLDAFVTADDAHRAARGVTPLQVEVPFGLDGADPLTLVLDDGRTLTFRGRADRVDAGADGHLVVLDYKTGKDHFGKQLEADPVMEGKTLQLGIYAEAALAQFGGSGADARYWMASGADRSKQRGYVWDDDRRSRFLDVVGVIVDGIEAGAFPGRPGAFDSYFGKHENCGFCDFDRVCPRNRDDHEVAKAGAPELSLLARLALAAPDEEAAP